MSKNKNRFIRPQANELLARLRESRQFIQVVAGPRQVGKTTMVQQAVEPLSIPVRYASADEPTLRGPMWIEQQWDAARLSATSSQGAVLILDEIQKVGNWSEAVKRLWDEDTRNRVPLRVVLLGSSPLLILKGLTESLSGRFEQTVLTHWSYSEMKQAFGFSLNEFIFYGGYPGAAPLIGNPERWRNYLLNSLIETTISRDILLMTRIDKPALLRQLFELACRYSGQVLSYNKMLGQLHDAGNTTTLAHYLNLLAAAGMVCGLPKFTGNVIRSRGSSPKLQVLNTGLMSALDSSSLSETQKQPERWGRLIESVVGTHLANSALRGECELYYWREGAAEVDFAARRNGKTTAIEVKSGRAPKYHKGTETFAKHFQPDRALLIGGDGIELEEFLSKPATHWVG
ncbi:MAG: ATP-binding protein [Lentisphaerae bacterium]|jgi:predicted AAA+ superfamily ATPase|nr:ATP-binding protein [Lentisphaerota bacterium]